MVSQLIVADQLSKAYGGNVLFNDAAFQIMAGERVALVGPNGAGKSTLLRILAGREHPDQGTLQLQAVRSHWFEQHPTIRPTATLHEVLAADRPVAPALANEQAQLEARIADPALYEEPGYESVLERYADLQREIAVAAAPPPPDENVLSDLGFTNDDLDRDAATLSGGERTRLFLARAVMNARPGDLVVLDEPTNHLDIESIEWLEDWANDFGGTLLVVAHDRAFLDNVAQRVFEISQGQVRTFKGNYEDYVEARDEDLARARREHAKAEQRLQKAEATIQQFRHQKRFDGQYASRMKTLDKYAAALERTPDPVLEKLGFGLQFKAAQKSSNEMMRLVGLTKSFDGRPVLRDVDFEIEKGDRVGLVGSNGAGKTTLLHVMTGRSRPDQGSLRIAPGVKFRFLSQENDTLLPNRTLNEEVLSARPGLEDRDVKALLGRFRFDPDLDFGRHVKTMSGGERQRLMLLKAVLEPSNMLILDEPTNHLDLWARDVVIQALNTYPGTLLVVSHDRFLLDSVTDKTAVLDQGSVRVFPGSFTQTRDLHRSSTGLGQRTRRYVVRKRFTDWVTKQRYHVDSVVELSDAAVETNRVFRTALHHGWLARDD